MIIDGEKVTDNYPCPYCGYSCSDPVHTSTTVDYSGKKVIDVTYKCRHCNREFTKTVFRREVD